ncbi:MAG: hypothetical protein OHK0039_26440 [Bacteroidia bacterium]
MAEYNETSVINVIIRLMPGGDELDVELPLYSTGKEIIDELLNGDMVPRNDPQGNPYTYKLVSKDSGLEIVPEKSLFSLGVKKGNTLLLMPELVAGRLS